MAELCGGGHGALNGSGDLAGSASDLAAVRLGFIGYGIMGERLLRAAARHDPAAIAVAGVWDPSSRAMERLARDFPEVPRAGSTHELIEASDCVYVASPPASHLGHAARILERGRAVFCEKPLAVDLEEARREHLGSRPVQRAASGRAMRCGGCDTRLVFP